MDDDASIMTTVTPCTGRAAVGCMTAYAHTAGHGLADLEGNASAHALLKQILVALEKSSKVRGGGGDGVMAHSRAHTLSAAVSGTGHRRLRRQA